MKNSKIPKIRFDGFTDDWEQRELGEVFKYERPDNYIVKSDDYDDKAKTPVLTANKGFLLGYTNETNTYDNESIIFDDFTLDMKLVKFPYMVKSSAIKILTLKDENKDFLPFAFERLSATKIEVMGHARHYISVVQPTITEMPKIKEQTKIGTFFATLDNLITCHQRKYDKLVNVKKSMLEKMFPKNGEKTPEIRFDGFTDDWEQREVSDIFKITRGDVLATTETSKKKTDEMQYPVYSSQTKDNGLMGYYNKFLFDNAITWTTDGANAGTVKYRAGEFYCTNVCGVLLSEDGYANKMVSEALNLVAWKYVSKVGNPKLMNNVMGEISIKIPTNIKEQLVISDFFATLDNLITCHQRELEKLKNIKKSMLEKMFV